MVQIFIVDDHPIIRQSLRALLGRETDLRICGEAATAEAALEQIEQKAPDLVLKLLMEIQHVQKHQNSL